MELALLEVETGGQARVRDRMVGEEIEQIDALRGIESLELRGLEVEEDGRLGTRSRRQLRAEVRLKMHKVVQEYQKLVRAE